jgi:hypothetical protein
VLSSSKIATRTTESLLSRSQATDLIGECGGDIKSNRRKLVRRLVLVAMIRNNQYGSEIISLYERICAMAKSGTCGTKAKTTKSKAKPAAKKAVAKKK